MEAHLGDSDGEARFAPKLLSPTPPLMHNTSFSSLSSTASSSRQPPAVHRLSVSSQGSHGTSGSDFDSSWAHDTSPFPSPSPSPNGSPPHENLVKTQYPKNLGPGSAVQTLDDRFVQPQSQVFAMSLPHPKASAGYTNLKIKSKTADLPDRWSTSSTSPSGLSSPTRRNASFRAHGERATSQHGEASEEVTPVDARPHTLRHTSSNAAKMAYHRAMSSNAGYFPNIKLNGYDGSSPYLSGSIASTRPNQSYLSSPDEHPSLGRANWTKPGSTPQAISVNGVEPRPWHDSPQAWLLYYFFLNLALTLYNKAVLFSFPFPYTLTGIHALCGAIGSYIFLLRGSFVPARLNEKEGLIMAAFSVLYTVNIAISNVSLHLVTVPFHQVVRAMTPLFTIILAVAFTRKRFGNKTYISLIPVVAGVAFATYGDYYFTPMGLFLTLLGTLLAALKTVVTNAIQVGRLRLHPLDLLLRMSPLAFVQTVIYAYTTGELGRVRKFGAVYMTRSMLLRLFINGIIAFFLNIVSFTANKKTSALTMTVAANVKQVLTIVLAVVIFNLTITPTNAVGIMLTLIGGAWYAKIEFQEKSAAKRVTSGAHESAAAPPIEKHTMLPQVAGEKTSSQ